MPKRNREGSMIDQPIMEIEANEEVMDIHIYLENEMFQIRKKKRRVWTSKKNYFQRKKEYFEKYAMSLQERDEYQCREINGFYCKEGYITGDKVKWNE